MVNIFSTTERLTKRENGKTADLTLRGEKGRGCKLLKRTEESHRLK